MKITRHHVHLEEENHQIEQCKWEISCHDVEEPVQAGTWAEDTGHAKGVSQGIVVRKTPPTKCPGPVKIGACGAVLTNTVVRQRVIDRVLQQLGSIFTIEETLPNAKQLLVPIVCGTVTIQDTVFIEAVFTAGNYPPMRSCKTLARPTLAVVAQRASTAVSHVAGYLSRSRETAGGCIQSDVLASVT